MEKDKFVPEGAVELAERAEEVAGDFEEVENEQELNALYGELGRIAMSEDEFEEDDESELESGLEGAERGAEEVKDAEEGEKADVDKEEWMRELDELNRETEETVREAEQAVQEAKEMAREVEWIMEVRRLDEETEKLLTEVNQAVAEAERMVRGIKEEQEGREERRAVFERVVEEANGKVFRAEEGWREWIESAQKTLNALKRTYEEGRFGGDETEMYLRRLGGLVADGGMVVNKVEKAGEDFG